MRTLLQDLLANISSKERRYQVTAIIRFYLNDSHEPSVDEMKQAILAIDAEYPWYDAPILNTPAASIHKIYSDPIVNNRHAHFCDFHIQPERMGMCKSQLYPYERYLWNIAERLMLTGLFSSVEVMIEITGRTCFKK